MCFRAQFPSQSSGGNFFYLKFPAESCTDNVFFFRTLYSNCMLRDNLTVLIVDDEPDICFLLGNMLKQKSFIPVIANTLSEGLDKLRQCAPSLLFLDIHLPDGSGLDIVRGIRRDFPGLKIIMMSAYDGMKERSRAIEEGADIFISKPLSRDLITQSVDKVMNRNI
jgi:two-component system, OmpR family, response regulator